MVKFIIYKQHINGTKQSEIPDHFPLFNPTSQINIYIKFKVSSDRMSSFSHLSLSLFMLAMIITFSNCHKMKKHQTTDLLDPVKLRPFMFKTQITGQLAVMVPFKQHIDSKGAVTMEQYQIEMIKMTKQILPSGVYPQTPIYAYGGHTLNGYHANFPGPAIFATKDRPIKVTWKNNIPGPHILPVDFNYPFKSSEAFVKEVPVVPHAHGIATNTSSDGQPEAYWTQKGLKSASYRTEEPCAPNEAVYYYPNQQQASNNWYHDHAIGITRLNVYAGLAGFYKILDPSNQQQKKITELHGAKLSQNETKFLIINDKSFKQNGELYYPTTTPIPGYSSWVPEFYGNVMLVNGEIWPKMTLEKAKHRFVLLNACQNRYLNLYFENLGKKIPIELLRVDGDYYDSQIIVNQLFATISSRIEFIVDLTYAQGEVILKNNAAAPYPDGDPENLVPEFTGQIMKIDVMEPANKQDSQISEKRDKKNIQIDDINDIETEPNIEYPTFSEGQKQFVTLFEVYDEQENVLAMFIDGVSMMNGMNCENSTFEIGKTYDFYIVNLSPDMHPIHFHLINGQKVKQFPFDVEEYTQKYFEINGGAPDRHGFAKSPISMDPEGYRTGDDELPKAYEKIFRDTIDVMPGYVTVIRIKFAKNDGTLFKSFEMKGQRYVMHCHMLEHEDNEMMKYYCLK